MNSLLWNYCCYQEAQTERRQRGRKKGTGGGAKPGKLKKEGVENTESKRGEWGKRARERKSDKAREGRGRQSQRERGMDDVVSGDEGLF